jgi:hypothetical protein
MSKHRDSEKLFPFQSGETGYHLPQPDKEIDKETVDEVDPGLGPEDQKFIRHYLGYADILLRAQRGKLIEMRRGGGNRKKKKAA